MRELRVADDFWSGNMLPEGILERWFVANGSEVREGMKIAEIRIEDARHEITAPASGRIRLDAAVNQVIEPGTLLAGIE